MCNTGASDISSSLRGNWGALDCDLAGAEKWTAAARVLVVVVVIFLIVGRTEHPSVERYRGEEEDPAHQNRRAHSRRSTLSVAYIPPKWADSRREVGRSRQRRGKRCCCINIALSLVFFFKEEKEKSPLKLQEIHHQHHLLSGAPQVCTGPSVTERKGGRQ